MTRPMFRPLTLDAFIEGTEIAVPAPACKLPDPGVIPNQGVEGDAMNFIATAPDVSEHDIGNPKVPGSLPFTMIRGTSTDPEHGMVPPGQLIAEVATEGVEITGGLEVPQP